MVLQDYYSLLGVNWLASEEEIRKAYLKRMHEVHPDRVDRSKHEAAWKRANQEAAKLNEAYNILSDPRARATYDSQTRRREPPRTEPQPGPAPSRRKPASAAPADGVAAKRCALSLGQYRFNELSEQTRGTLLLRQKDLIQPQVRVPLSGIGWIFFWVTMGFTWFGYLVVASAQAPWDVQTLLMHGGISAVAAPVLWHLLITSRMWLGSALKNNLFITPLYIIECKNGWVRYWPILSIEDFNATHVYHSFFYERTDVKFRFQGVNFLCTINNKALYERFVKQLLLFDSHLRAKSGASFNTYIAEHDDFRYVSQGQASGTKAERSENLTGYLAAMVVCSIVFFFAYGLNTSRSTEGWFGYSDVGSRKEAQGSASNSYGKETSGWSSHSSGPIAGPTLTTAPPAQRKTVPRHGRQWRNHRGRALAPLTIVTDSIGTYYYVKMTLPGSTDTVVSVFIHGGKSVELYMPLGIYEMKYVTGKYWYGQRVLFGEQGQYTKADALFHFSDTGNYYSGYTVELFRQVNGNLQTRPISPENF